MILRGLGRRAIDSPNEPDTGFMAIGSDLSRWLPYGAKNRTNLGASAGLAA
jgi:hypothetical protein